MWTIHRKRREIRYGLNALLPLAFLCLLPVFAVAQTEEAAKQIDRVLEKKESKWQCARLMKIATAIAPHAPRGVYYRLQCQRGGLTVLGLVFFAESAQDAARRLEWSLKDVQTFQTAPLPLAALGEQAYQQQRPGMAVVAFRKGKLFAQVSVTVNATTPKDGAHPAKLEKATTEAMKTARRFTGHLAAQGTV